MHTARVLFAPSALAVLRALEASGSKTQEAIARRVRGLAIMLEKNFLHGEVVRKGFLPVELVRNHDAENLYIEDLPLFWRMIYTLKQEAGQRHLIILEIVSHGTYDRWFPGRGR